MNFEFLYWIYAGPNVLPLKVRFYNMIKCTLHPGVGREENGILSKSATPSLIQYSLCLVVRLTEEAVLGSQCLMFSAGRGKPVFSECGLDRLLEMQVPLPFAPHLSSPQ